MANDFEINTKDFVKSLLGYSDGVLSDLQEAVADCALKTERGAKKNCPVDTGMLRASITSDIGVLEAEVGTNVEYAAYVEYGTSKQGAKPFLRPALDSSLKQLEKDIAKALGGK